MTPHFAGLARVLLTTEFLVLEIDIGLFARKSRYEERRDVYSMSKSKSLLYKTG